MARTSDKLCPIIQLPVLLVAYASFLVSEVLEFILDISSDGMHQLGPIINLKNKNTETNGYIHLLYTGYGFELQLASARSVWAS